MQRTWWHDVHETCAPDDLAMLPWCRAPKSPLDLNLGLKRTSILYERSCGFHLSWRLASWIALQFSSPTVFWGDDSRQEPHSQVSPVGVCKDPKFGDNSRSAMNGRALVESGFTRAWTRFYKCRCNQRVHWPLCLWHGLHSMLCRLEQLEQWCLNAVKLSLLQFPCSASHFVLCTTVSGLFEA